MPKVLSPLVAPIVTEKSSREQDKGKYAFLVRKETNKVEIKKAIKEIYGADVEKVSISLVPSKVRVFGRRKEYVKRPVYKKAIVTLKDKKTIDPNKLSKNASPAKAKASVKSVKKTSTKKS